MQYPFKIYSSSAGSGKTYTLTREYLRLALQSDNPVYFKQILAITFTNDAANEMKERIMLALKGFADARAIPEDKQDANQALLQQIVQELNLYNDDAPITEAIIRRRAARLFKNILYDYSDFAVSTIDSFVNRLVSAFTEELNIPFNYEVNMDAMDLLDNAIDRLLSRVGDAEEMLLSDILEGFAMEKADEGKSWGHLTDELSKFGLNLLNERVYEAVGKLKGLGLKDFKELRKQLTEANELLKGQISSLADEALELIQNQGLDGKCFVGGSNGIHGYFSKLCENVDSRITWAPTEAFLRGLDSSDWAPKAIKDAQRNKVNALSGTLYQYFEAIEKLKGEYMLITAMLRHFYKLSIIHEISKELVSIKSEKNVVHISDFNKAIINIVLQEPVPFIYERLGEKYNHILIDEFQDTSVLQWNNLLPLIENSLAKGNFNLIVGDAKQAIYGWRGGDMEQIVYLTQKRFKELIKKHQQADLLALRYETFQHSLLSERLNINYRSAAQIVSFNNELFRLLTRLHSADKRLLSDVYDSFFEQQMPVTPRNGGHVQIRFIENTKEEEGETDEEDSASPYQRRTLQAVMQLIEEAMRAGYHHRDIAILNRSNHAGKLIANYLKENGIEVISQDSLLLQYAESVTLLIAFFQVISMPDNVLNRYEALHLYHTHILHSLPDAASAEVKNILENASIQPLYDYLAKYKHDLDVFKLQQSGIYELTEKLIHTFGLFEKPRQSAYLFRFLDVVLEFSIKHSNHLADFMEYWAIKKESLCINTPKDWDAVTVTSIHKSKGLEYPVVIVPFADWELSHKKEDLMWVNLEAESLSHSTYLLHTLPIQSATISPVQDLKRTPLQAQYNQDAEKVFVEGLNTLYVALTRPTDRLYLLSKNGNFERSKTINVSYLLYQYLHHTGVWEADTRSYLIHQGGDKPVRKARKSEYEVYRLNKIVSTDWQDKARLRRIAGAIFNLENFEKNKDLNSKLCHALTKITYTQDVEKVVMGMCMEGLLDKEEEEALREALGQLLSHELIAPLFDKKVQVITAHDILCSQALSLQSPDRVVVDGNKISIINFVSCPPTETDIRPLNRYARYLAKMGYEYIEKLLICTEDRSAMQV